ncbi:MAG: TldD/PmbA family protein [Candidatus Sumerlaeia bacterium]
MRKNIIDANRDGIQAALDRAISKGAAAKIKFGHKEAASCQFDAGEIKEIGESENIGYHIEVIKNGKRGRASGNRMDRLNEMVDQALILAESGSRAWFDLFPSPGPATRVLRHSSRTADLSLEEIIDACKLISKKLKDENPDLYIRCNAEREEGESLLVTSGGLSYPDKGTQWSIIVEMMRTRGNDMLIHYDGRSWRDVNEYFDPEAIADRMIEEARRSEHIVPPPTGAQKAFLPPEMVARLFSVFAMGLNGRHVAKNESPLAGRLGEEMLDPSITIADHPHESYASGAAEIDSDGIPTRDQTLFDKGVLKMFLYDLDSAGMAGKEPTGNSSCSPWNIKVRPGRTQSSKLLGEIDEGVYVRNVLGFGQGNLINGDFSCNLGLGYRIEKGEITGRVKNTMISGNVYDLFKENVVLSKDTDYEGSYPHAVIEGLQVSA